MEMVVILRCTIHFGTICGYFGTIFGHIGGQTQSSQTSHVTTQNDSKRSRIPMEMVLESNLRRSGHLGTICGYFWAQT